MEPSPSVRKLSNLIPFSKFFKSSIWWTSSRMLSHSVLVLSCKMATWNWKRSTNSKEPWLGMCCAPPLFYQCSHFVQSNRWVVSQIQTRPRFDFRTSTGIDSCLLQSQKPGERNRQLSRSQKHASNRSRIPRFELHPSSSISSFSAFPLCISSYRTGQHRSHRYLPLGGTVCLVCTLQPCTHICSHRKLEVIEFNRARTQIRSLNWIWISEHLKTC